MPRQNSILLLSGRMGDQIYYYRKDKKNRKHYFVRQAPATVKQTAATKNAATDFGTASKSSSLIRKGLQEYITHSFDNSLHYRLNKKMGDILRADINHASGQRAITEENMQFLQHFRFNNDAGIQCTTIIEKNNTGEINISFPEIIRSSGNTTHIAVKAIALSVNFAKNTTQRVESNTVVIKPGGKCTPLTMKINRRNITLIVLQIQSFYEVNGQLYVSQNSKGHALDVIAVLPPIEEQVKQRKYRNKAPRFWTPYTQPVQRDLIIKPVRCNSLPEG